MPGLQAASQFNTKHKNRMPTKQEQNSTQTHWHKGAAGAGRHTHEGLVQLQSRVVGIIAVVTRGGGVPSGWRGLIQRCKPRLTQQRRAVGLQQLIQVQQCPLRKLLHKHTQTHTSVEHEACKQWLATAHAPTPCTAGGKCSGARPQW